MVNIHIASERTLTELEIMEIKADVMYFVKWQEDMWTTRLFNPTRWFKFMLKKQIKAKYKELCKRHNILTVAQDGIMPQPEKFTFTYTNVPQ